MSTKPDPSPSSLSPKLDPSDPTSQIKPTFSRKTSEELQSSSNGDQDLDFIKEDSLIMYFDFKRQKFRRIKGESFGFFPRGNTQVSEIIKDLEAEGKRPYYAHNGYAYLSLFFGVLLVAISVLQLVLNVILPLVLLSGLSGLILVIFGLYQLIFNWFFDRKIMSHFEKMEEIYKIKLRKYEIEVNLTRRNVYFLEFFSTEFKEKDHELKTSYSQISKKSRRKSSGREKIQKEARNCSRRADNKKRRERREEIKKRNKNVAIKDLNKSGEINQHSDRVSLKNSITESQFNDIEHVDDYKSTPGRYRNSSSHRRNSKRRRITDLPKKELFKRKNRSQRSNSSRNSQNLQKSNEKNTDAQDFENWKKKSFVRKSSLLKKSSELEVIHEHENEMKSSPFYTNPKRADFEEVVYSEDEFSIKKSFKKKPKEKIPKLEIRPIELSISPIKDTNIDINIDTKPKNLHFESFGDNFEKEKEEFGKKNEKDIKENLRKENLGLGYNEEVFGKKITPRLPLTSISNIRLPYNKIFENSIKKISKNKDEEAPNLNMIERGVQANFISPESAISKSFYVSEQVSSEESNKMVNYFKRVKKL